MTYSTGTFSSEITVERQVAQQGVSTVTQLADVPIPKSPDDFTVWEPEDGEPHEAFVIIPDSCHPMLYTELTAEYPDAEFLKVSELQRLKQ